MDEHQCPSESTESDKDNLISAAGNLKEAAGAKAEDLRQAAGQKADELRSAAQERTEKQFWTLKDQRSRAMRTRGPHHVHIPLPHVTELLK